jgi:hypothetical protein
MASNYITCTKETTYLTIAYNLWRPSQVLQHNHTWFFRVVIAVTDSLPPSFSLFPFLNINFERGYLTKAITCNPLPIGWAPKYIPKNLDIECNSENTNSKGDGLIVGYTITWSMFHIKILLTLQDSSLRSLNSVKLRYNNLETLSSTPASTEPPGLFYQYLRS